MASLPAYARRCGHPSADAQCESLSNQHPFHCYIYHETLLLNVWQCMSPSMGFCRLALAGSGDLVQVFGEGLKLRRRAQSQPRPRELRRHRPLRQHGADRPRQRPVLRQRRVTQGNQRIRLRPRTGDALPWRQLPSTVRWKACMSQSSISLTGCDLGDKLGASTNGTA